LISEERLLQLSSRLHQELLKLTNELCQTEDEQHAFLFCVTTFGSYFMTQTFGSANAKRMLSQLHDGLDDIEITPPLPSVN
jgi:hypothetical protein